MAEGDIDLGAFLDKYSPTPAPKPEPELPEIKATRQTYYYPATPEATRAAGLSYGMEGGIKGGPGFSDVDLREHTIEKFKEGKSPYVAVAMAGKPTGELFRTIVEGTPITGKWVDTGGGLAPGQQDIATSNPDLARGGGTGGAPAPEYPGISPMMQIAMEKPAARPEEPQAPDRPRASSAGISPAPVPNFMTPTVMPQVQPIETPPIQMGIGQAIQQTPIPQPQQQDVDLGAFLAARMTPTPAPAETPAPAAQDIDLGAFLASRVSAQELPQALSGAPEPSIPRGIAQGLGDLLPRSIGQAVGMLVQTPVTETPHAFKEAYDVMRGVSVEQAVPESQAYVGKNKEELARTITGQAAQIGMGLAGLKAAVRPRVRAGKAAIKPAAAEPERIASSAWKLQNGKIVSTGPLHGEPPQPNAEVGFLTTKDRFLNREQAGELATGLKQELRGEDFFQELDVVPSLAEHPIAQGGKAAAKPAAAEPPTTPPGGNGPPSEINRESGEPMPEHPESSVLAEASKGNMFSRVARAFRSFRDTFTIEPLPNLRRAGLRDSGYAHASSRNAIMPVVRDKLSRVFPEQYKDPVAMKVTGDVLVKDNVLGIYDQIKAQLERPDLSAKERTRLTQNMADLEGSVAQYDADVRAAMQDPMTAANVARWKEWVNPEMERMYRELRNEDPNAVPDPRGRYTGARVNLLPEFKAESLVDMLDHTKTMPEPSYSNYRNPNVKADPFARHAKGTGEYSNDPMLMLINSLGQRYVETTKLQFYKDIVANGQGIITEPGTHIGNKDLTRMPARMPETNPETGKVRTVEKTLWVNKQIADEVRQVLNVDKLGGGNPLFQWATGLQLMQGIDMTAHLKNIHTVIANSLGQSAMGDLARRFPGISSIDAVARMTAVTKEVMADTPEIRAEIADMARRGEIRPKYPSTGFQKITHFQNVIHEADTAARIIMKRFWENNVRRGRVVDNVDARRQFINQIGEYNQRVMNDYQRRVRNMGLSPFVVAGRSFNAFSRRLIFGSIGFKPANLGQAILLRSLNLTSLAVTTATVAAFNYALTGKPGGRAGVPLGAIDTGKNDENGKPILVDVFQLIGIRRGLRATGTGAVIEGMRKGQTAREIGTQAGKDVISTAAGPWVGPGLHALFGVLWGKRLDLRSGDMYQIGRKLKPGEGIQELENVRATLRDTNPLIYSIISPVFGEAQNKEDVDRNWGSRLYQGAITPMERSVGVRPMTKQEMTGTSYEKKKSKGTPVYIGR